MMALLCGVEQTLFSSALAGNLEVSWAANTEADLAGYKVYYGQESGKYLAHIDVKLALKYAFNNLTEGQTYYFAVTAYDTAGNESGYSVEVSAQVPVTDKTPPTLTSAKALTQNKVEVQFSEPITKASAEQIANYAIVPAIAINSAALQADTRTVILTTAPHVDGQTYTLIAKDISDRATPANALATPDTLKYEFHVPDTKAPVLISARALDQNKVEVQFSEAITKSSAEQVANYNLAPLLAINSATLQSDTRTVILATSSHADSTTYTLSVQNIQDRATPPNTIATPATKSYPFLIPDTTAPKLVNAHALSQNKVEVQFSEPITKASAEMPANYTISPQIPIGSAVLQADTRTVILTTSPHVDGTTYTLSVQNMQDRATPPNTMVSLATLSYKFQIMDTTPPMLVSARALDQNSVAAQFSERVSQASAENIANYNITPPISINAAVLQGDGRTVRLSTSAHLDGVNYTLNVQSILDLATPPNVIATPAAASYLFALADTRPPMVTEVRALDHTQVEVRFDESLTRSSAENLANFTIDQGINVVSVALHSDERGVLLNTSPHTDGVTYQLTVRKIADRATPPNVMPASTIHPYTFLAKDIQPPRVVSAALTNLTTLVLTFDEKVTRASAENAGNYRINDNEYVLSAHLDAFEQEVTLTTTEHVYNRTYLLRLSGIVDASTNANAMTDTLRIPYSLQGSGDKQNGNLTISSWTPEYYLMDTLRVGQKHYMDLANTVTHVPARLRNKLMFRTANRDRQMKSENFFEFNLNHLADVYVIYDSRAEEVPQWLRDNFLDNNQKITVATNGGSSVPMKVWKGRFSPGRVQLGGNMANGVKTNTPLNMYFVLIEDLELRAKDESEQPKLFELANNYPNPLNLNAGAQQTVIECRLRQESRVIVKVYNMLGQAVRTLHDGVLSAGTHPLIWNGRDENSEPVPSGKYLYSLEILEEIKQGDFTLTASLNRQTRVMTVLR
ncbi:fibronectin type III domain-containing protein [candidate division KSB1 bacterium]|nr:fibronectin type III domain-containing protein [candidate division KSB1 bacterium]